MARPYSSDLRERVVEAVNEGATRHETAERFSISVSSAVRWHQAWRNEGRYAAKPYGGSRSPLEDHAEEIVALIEERRDRTLDEIVAAMHKRKIPGSRTALFRFLERHGITLKKKSCTPPSRSGRTSPAPVGAGYASKGCLIRLALSSSMKPRLAPA
jgi:transposase